jgi:hypothetical protein
VIKVSTKLALMKEGKMHHLKTKAGGIGNSLKSE